MESDPLDEKYFINFEKVHSFYYTTYDDWAMCTMLSGCNERTTSEAEYNALVDFYDGFRGASWRINDNWLEGDPCLNQWYGVQCNVKGQIIVLHFFENHLVGEFKESFVDLVYLKHLSIFNGELEFEGKVN